MYVFMAIYIDDMPPMLLPFETILQVLNISLFVTYNDFNGCTQATLHFSQYRYGNVLFFGYFHTVNVSKTNLPQCHENLNVRYIG